MIKAQNTMPRNKGRMFGVRITDKLWNEINQLSFEEGFLSASDFARSVLRNEVKRIQREKKQNGG